MAAVARLVIDEVAARTGEFEGGVDRFERGVLHGGLQLKFEEGSFPGLVEGIPQVLMVAEEGEDVFYQRL